MLSRVGNSRAIESKWTPVKVTIANISAELIAFDSVILLDDKYTELRGQKKKKRGRLPPAQDGGINKVFYLRQSSVF